MSHPGEIRLSARRNGRRGETIILYRKGGRMVAEYPGDQWREAMHHFHVEAIMHGYTMPRRDAWYAVEYVHRWIRENPDCGLEWAVNTPEGAARKARKQKYPRTSMPD